MGRRSTTIAPPITPFPSFPPTASKRTRTHKQSFLVPPRDVVLVFSCVHFLITGRVIVCVLSSNVRQRVTRSLPTAARHPSPLSSFSGVPRDRVYITVDANIRMSIQNLNVFDPFADAIKGADDDVQDGLVHIRIQQRNGRKTLTTVQGLSSEYDLKKIVRACKKEFACNGTVVEHPEYGEVLQLQGDQRENICQWLTKCGLAKSDQLKVHGF